MRQSYYSAGFSLFITLFIFFIPLSSVGQTVSWTAGGDSTSWDDPANWSTGSVPDSGNDVIIDLNTDEDYSIEISQNRSVGSLSMDTRNVNLVLNANLTVANSYYQNFSTLTGNGDLTVEGDLTFDNGTMSGSGTTFANGDSQFNSGILDSRRFVVASGQTLSRTDSFDGRNGAILEIESNATFDNQTGRYMSIASDSNSPPKIINHGLMVHSTERRPSISWSIENHGTILVEPGNHLRLTGQIIDNGGAYRADGDGAQLDLLPTADVTFNTSSQLDVSSGAQLRLGHSSENDTAPQLTISGTLNAEGTLKLGESFPPVELVVTQEADVQNAGGDALIVGDRAVVEFETTDPVNAGSVSLNFEGELFMNSSLTIEEFLDLNNASVVFDSDEETTVLGSMNWEGGDISGEGSIIADGGLELTGGAGSSSNVKRLIGHELIIAEEDTAKYIGDLMRAGDGARLTIEEGAVFDFQGEGNLKVLSESASVPEIINQGTIIKSAGNFESEVGWALENYGTVQSASDQFLFYGPVTDQNGNYRASSGGHLLFQPALKAVTFKTGSFISSDTTGTISFGRRGGAEPRDTSLVYQLNGTINMDGTTKVSEPGEADVTVTADATIEELAGTALVMDDLSGIFRSEHPDSLIIGSISLGQNNQLFLESPLIVEGDVFQNESKIETNYSIQIDGEYEWSGGNLVGSDTLTVNGGMRMTDGGVLDSLHILVPGGETAVINTRGFGTNRLDGRNGASLEIRENSRLEIQGWNDIDLASESSAPPAIINHGTLTNTGGYEMAIRWPLENSGIVDVQNGRIRFAGPVTDRGGEYLTSGARLDFYSDADISLIDETSVIVDSDGVLSINSDGDFRVDGDLSVDGELFTETPIRSEGRVSLNDPGTIIHGSPGNISNNPDSVIHLVNGGEFQGTGFITGDVVSDSGSVHPGGKEGTGILTIQGDYTQRSGGSLDLELGGSSPGDGYDRLDIENADLDGELRLALINGYSPGSNDVLEPIRWSDDRSGSFASVDYSETGDANLGTEYSSGALRIFDGSLPDPPSAPTISVQASAPSFARTDRAIPVNIEISSSSNVAIGILETDNIAFDISSPTNHCPMDDAYENLKCRLEPFGVVPPEPSEGEEYPFLTYIPVQQVLSQSGNVTKEGADLMSNAKTTTNKYSERFNDNISKLTTSRAAFIRSGGLNIGGTASCQRDGQNLRATAGVPGPIMTNESLDRCAAEAGTKILQNIGSAIIPGFGCYSLYTDIKGQIKSGFKNNHDMAAGLASNVLGALDCADDFVPATKAISIMRELNSQIRTASDFETCFAQKGGGGGSGGSQITCVGAIDPNEKMGPQGVREERFTTRQDSLPYTVFFENKAEATAPAQQVVIFDTLSTDRYNFDSFTFGAVAFGDTSVTTPNDTLAFQKEVDLLPERDLTLKIEGDVNEESGIISWTFSSIDPETGEPTTDPLAGFLPPNEEAPEGEGSVSYFADVSSDASSGTRIGSAARIIFDQNDPIDTAIWSNVLDLEPPESEVNSFDAAQDSTGFVVSWTGSDAESGIRSFSIYVSEDGEPFNVWIEDTTATSAEFVGDKGSEYRFYSTSVDSVGLEEEAPAEPDAVTMVTGDATSTGSGGDEIPEQFTLQQNYPNPFNPSTTIRFGLPEESDVTLTVYNTMGREVATLIQNENRPAGWYHTTFDASHLSSGIYIYRLETDKQTLSEKLTLIK